MLTETTCGALDPAPAGASLAEYGDANMELILRGLQPKSHSVYLEGWRLRVVPTLGHLPPALVIPGVLDRAVHGWIADGLSASVIKNALAILGRTLEQARRDGLIEVNPTPVERYPSVLHGYWALSAADPRDRAAIRDTASAREAHDRGGAAARRTGWAAMRPAVMAGLLRGKFTQHPELAAILLATGDAAPAENLIQGCDLLILTSGHRFPKGVSG